MVKCDIETSWHHNHHHYHIFFIINTMAGWWNMISYHHHQHLFNKIRTQLKPIKAPENNMFRLFHLILNFCLVHKKKLFLGDNKDGGDDKPPQSCTSWVKPQMIRYQFIESLNLRRRYQRQNICQGFLERYVLYSKCSELFCDKGGISMYAMHCVIKFLSLDNASD